MKSRKMLLRSQELGVYKPEKATKTYEKPKNVAEVAGIRRLNARKSNKIA